jgi:hypothetical protein
MALGSVIGKSLTGILKITGEAVGEEAVLSLGRRLLNLFGPSSRVIIHRVMPGGISLADEIGTVSRLGQLTPIRAANVSKFVTEKLDSDQQLKFRMVIAASKELPGEEKGQEVVRLRDDALKFLHLLGSPKLEDDQRLAICQVAGILDIVDLDAKLTEVGNVIETSRQKMENALLPQQTPSGARWTTRLFYWFKNL